MTFNRVRCNCQAAAEELGTYFFLSVCVCVSLCPTELRSASIVSAFQRQQPLSRLSPSSAQTTHWGRSSTAMRLSCECIVGPIRTAAAAAAAKVQPLARLLLDSVSLYLSGSLLLYLALLLYLSSFLQPGEQWGKLSLTHEWLLGLRRNILRMNHCFVQSLHVSLCPFGPITLNPSLTPTHRHQSWGHETHGSRTFPLRTFPPDFPPPGEKCK